MKSPKPKKIDKKELTFNEAITKLLTGKSITKLEWGDKEYHVLLMNERLTLHKPDGYHDWIVSEADMRGTDYVIL